ncbi:MAG: glycosyl hydrolase 53 family protein [Bacteroidales bacterium]|nr:glycosyl hydrolase 53 family protein [Bacteroidales bacterium]
MKPSRKLFPPAPHVKNPSIFSTLFIIIILLTLSLFSPSCKKESSTSNPYGYKWTDFAMGADLSYVNQILDHGGLYRDSGKIMDPYEIFRNHGCNVVRLRLWHNPVWTKEVYGDNGTQMYNDLADVMRAIQRAKELGMAVNLDFHYSDTWADPHRQDPPAAWKGLTLSETVDSMYQYTYHTLTILNESNLMPEMVQIGNEINPGILLPLGGTNKGWVALGQLLNAGIRAVRDVSRHSDIHTKIILHVAQPENVHAWFMNVTRKGGVSDFDIVGFSYYSKWSIIPLNQIRQYVKNFKESFKKEIMCVETAYPWTYGSADQRPNIFNPDDAEPGYPATPEGQYKYLTDLTLAIYNGGGSGIMVWEPAWITSSIKDLWGTGSAWENCTFFDFNSQTLLGINFMQIPLN